MTTKHSSRPIVAWSPLNPDTLPWLNDLADGLAKRGCHFVLLTDGASMPGCRFPALQVPFSLPAYPARFASGARAHELPAKLANLLAQRSRAWWGRPTESLDSHLAATHAAAAFFDRLFRRLKPALVLTWGSSLPQSTIIQHLAECQRVPSFVLERGLLPGTLMIDQRGHGGRSDLNTFLGSPALSESPLNPAAYHQARDYYLRNGESKYPQAARLAPEEIRRRHAPDAQRVVTFFGQWDVASGLLPETAGDASLQSPAFSSTAAGLRAIEDAVRAMPGTALWFKPHPHDPTDYTAIVQAGTTLFRDANLRDVIEASDATAFMLSTAQFEALLHEKPCLLMARSQLWGKGVGYEVESAAQLPTALREALAAKDLGQRCERQRSWLGGVLRNYLVRTRPEIPAGRSLEDFAAFLANNSLPATGSVEIGQQLSLLAQELSAAKEIEASSAATPPADALTARLIAFYLPQFHPIPENDRWWGRGFTEWTNAAKARPRFPEHYQPHLPGELGFYDLRLAEVRAEQAQLARAHGIEGFCYWHYWFNGKRLLERPVEEILASGQPDFPFCLAWANENWTRRWDGNDREMLQEQTYGGETDDRAHFECLLPALRDSRAIRIAGRPLFLIYRPASLPDASATIRVWRELATQAGLPGLYLIAMRTGFDASGRDWREAGFDGELYFQPDFSAAMQHASTVDLTKDRLVDYPQGWRAMSAAAESFVVNRNAFPSVVPCWDNSARRKEGSFILHDSSPAEYAQWLRKEINGVQSRPHDQRVVFLNAWNEWAEGNHLEPDQRWGRAYLEETRNAVNGDPVNNTGIPPVVNLVVPTDPSPKPPATRPEKPFESTEALLERAGSLRQASQWNEAGAAYLMLSSRLPNDLSIWRARLECACQQGHAVMADLILDEALERHPEWSKVLKEAAEAAPAKPAPAPAKLATVTPTPSACVSEGMKREWNECAAEDARYYVRSTTRDQSEAEFDASGRDNVERLVFADLPRIAAGRDPQAMTMLEIGCGVGRMSKHFARHFGQVHAIDVSGEMIRQARERLGMCAPNLVFHETSGADLALFTDEMFDLVFSFIVFQNIPDRAIIFNCIREAHRVLKPGGAFKFQVQGCTEKECMALTKDTWFGVTITEEDVTGLSQELGFDLLAKSGQGTQYSWFTVRKQIAAIPRLDPTTCTSSSAALVATP